MILEGLSVLDMLSVEGRGDWQLREGSPLALKIHVSLPLPCSRTHHGYPWPLREILTPAAAAAVPAGPAPDTTLGPLLTTTLASSS